MVNIIINNIKRNKIFFLVIVFSIINILLLLIPVVFTSFKNEKEYFNGLSSLFFLNDQSDLAYYGATFILMYIIFNFLLMISTIVIAYKINSSNLKRIKMYLIYEIIIQFATLIISLSFYLNTKTNVQIHFGFYIIISINLICSVLLLIKLFNNKFKLEDSKVN